MRILTSADIPLTKFRKREYAHVLRGEEVWLQRIGWYEWGPIRTAKGKVVTDSVPFTIGCVGVWI